MTVFGCTCLGQTSPPPRPIAPLYCMPDLRRCLTVSTSPTCGAPATHADLVSAETREAYAKIVDGILGTVDLDSVSSKQIRLKLQAVVGKDLSSQKVTPPETTATSTNVSTPTVNHSEVRVGAKSESHSPVSAKREASSDTSDVIDDARPKKKTKRVEAETDAALAARLQAEEDRRQRATRGGGSRTKRPPVKAKTPKKHAKTKSASKISANDDSDVESGSMDDKPVKKNGAFHVRAFPTPIWRLIADVQTETTESLRTVVTASWRDSTVTAANGQEDLAIRSRLWTTAKVNAASPRGLADNDEFGKHPKIKKPGPSKLKGVHGTMHGACAVRRKMPPDCGATEDEAEALGTNAAFRQTCRGAIDREAAERVSTRPLKPRLGKASPPPRLSSSAGQVPAGARRIVPWSSFYPHTGSAPILLLSAPTTRTPPSLRWAVFLLRISLRIHTLSCCLPPLACSKFPSALHSLCSPLPQVLRHGHTLNPIPVLSTSSRYSTQRINTRSSPGGFHVLQRSSPGGCAAMDILRAETYKPAHSYNSSDSSSYDRINSMSRSESGTSQTHYDDLVPDTSPKAEINEFTHTSFEMDRPPPSSEPTLQARPFNVDADPMAMHLLLESAVSDSKAFEILSPEQFDRLKKDEVLLARKVETAKRNLQLEKKVRTAAQSMNRLGNKGVRSSTESKELIESAQKCEALAQELLELERQQHHFQEKRLKHTAAVFQLERQQQKTQGASGQKAAWRDSNDWGNGFGFGAGALANTADGIMDLDLEGDGPSPAVQNKLRSLNDTLSRILASTGHESPQLADNATADQELEQLQDGLLKVEGLQSETSRLWDVIGSGEEDLRQRRLQTSRGVDSDESDDDDDDVPVNNEQFSLQAFSTKIQRLCSRAANLQEKQNSLRSKLDHERSMHGQAKQQLEASRGNEEAQAQLQQVQDHKQELEQKLATAEQAKGTVEKDKEGLESEVARLTTEVTMARAELESAYGSRAERAAEALKPEVDQLTAKNEQLGQELSELVAEHEALVRQGVEAERDRETLEGTVDTLREKLEGLEIKLNEEKVRLMAAPGSKSDVGREATSMGVMRTEFKKMMREARAEHFRNLRAKTRGPDPHTKERPGSAVAIDTVTTASEQVQAWSNGHGIMISKSKHMTNGHAVLTSFTRARLFHHDKGLGERLWLTGVGASVKPTQASHHTPLVATPRLHLRGCGQPCSSSGMALAPGLFPCDAAFPPPCLVSPWDHQTLIAPCPCLAALTVRRSASYHGTIFEQRFRRLTFHLLLPIAVSGRLRHRTCLGCPGFNLPGLLVTGISLDVDDTASINKAAAAAASNLIAYYQTTGGGFPVPDAPWDWYLSGAAWASYIDYYSYANDDTYLNKTLDAFSQTANQGPNFDFNTQDNSEANDDHAFWVFAALTALEEKLPTIACPASNTECGNSWLYLANNAFNDFTARWEANKGTCNGGLTWGYVYNPGAPGQLQYKNSVSNGGFFQIAARLARYTGDAKYAEWAEKVWSWSKAVGFLTSTYHVLDGAGISDNCANPDPTEWTYNSGIYMYGAAAMADYYDGKNATWNKRVSVIVDTAISQFTTSTAKGRILVESARNCDHGPAVSHRTDPAFSLCDTPLNTDQKAFKGYLAHFMGKTAALVPSAAKKLLPVLQASAKGAAKVCSGPSNGNLCSQVWYVGYEASRAGMQPQMIAFDLFNSLLSVKHKPKSDGDDNRVFESSSAKPLLLHPNLAGTSSIRVSQPLTPTDKMANPRIEEIHDDEEPTNVEEEASDHGDDSDAEAGDGGMCFHWHNRALSNVSRR
ncbi:hypothetical protein FH972_021222 [Carpinus fangiana]|uniref:mannan endo-1,6-alpha-mannosidase n=1 Tax=Carpinus fangiana TaxID=176857 RepID=A0A5N6KP39_9ROSI|nr:hypothetical protein FH972_021222 [Carpinus fangiana]